jgi:hypothetical protein
MERLPMVAPRAAGVQHRPVRDAVLDAHAVVAHGLGEPEQFLGGFPLHAQRGQEGGDLRRGGAAFQNLGHRRHGLGRGERFPVKDLVQVGQERHAIVKCGAFFEPTTSPIL